MSSQGDEGLRFPWSRSDRPFPRRVIQPLQAFLQTEASSGLVLLAATVAALVWANSPFRSSYEGLWGTRLTVSLGPWTVTEDLRHWVNDGLMTLFFFVVGLEIKREVVQGALGQIRSAALPVVAAVGGMVVPALLYVAVNPGGAEAKGWGIPMATDIAFALAVLGIAGRGLPESLKTFLLALAIVDDVGAIVVIAVFYSGGIDPAPAAAAAGLLLSIIGLQRLQIRVLPVYVLLGAAVWLATYESGIHPTIAGVALGLVTPALPFQRPKAVSEAAHRIADHTSDHPDPPDADWPHWLHLASLSREAVSPLARLEPLLHPWTGFLVVPLFALANAGVRLDASAVGDALGSPVAIGVGLGLVVGKPLGIMAASWAAVRSGIARLPEGVRWPSLLGTASLAGIGFTVSLFISNLAFEERGLGGASKVGILAASVLAGLIGSAVLRIRVGRSTL